MKRGRERENEREREREDERGEERGKELRENTREERREGGGVTLTPAFFKHSIFLGLFVISATVFTSMCFKIAPTQSYCRASSGRPSCKCVLCV
jgi:hypothetical protein